MENVINKDEPLEKQTCLMVLSMHLSGSSLLAKCLHHLGINLGKNLYAGRQGNGDGGFGNQDIVLFHEILFRDLGCRWDMVGSLPEGWLQSEAGRRAEKRLTRIIEEHFLDGSPLAVSDPRLCRFLPLWRSVLEKFDINPRYIHLVRHPHEVATSLKHRFQKDFHKSHLLWLTYNRDALQSINGQRHALLTFDQLLADPVSAMLRIAGTLDFYFPCDPLENSHTLTEIARSDLKHHHVDRNDTNYSQFSWVYEQFRLKQVKAIEAKSDFKDTIGEPLSDFPMVPTTEAVAANREARGHAVEMFNNLLNVIGRYEQVELNERLQRQRRLISATHSSEALFAQLYYPDCSGSKDYYSDENTDKILLAPNEWQSISWDIRRPQDLRTKRLRMKPLNTRGLISISNMQIINAATSETYWSAEKQGEYEKCIVGGDGLVLSMDKGLTMICMGNDAQLQLPVFPDLPDSPMQFKVWIKAGRDQTILKETWSRLNEEKTVLEKKLNEKTLAFEQGSKNIIDLKVRIEDLQQELSDEKQEHESMQSSLRGKISEVSSALDDERAKSKRLETELQSQLKNLGNAKQEHESMQGFLRGKISELSSALDDERDKAKRVETELQSQLKDLGNAKREHESMQSSLQAKIKELSSTLDDERDKYRGAETQLQSEKIKFQYKINDLKAQLEKEVNKAAANEAQVLQIRQQLNEKESELQLQKSKDRNEIERTQTAIRSLEKQLKEKSDELEVLEHKLKEQKDHQKAQKEHLQKRLQNQENIARQYFEALQKIEVDQQEKTESLRRQLLKKQEQLNEIESRLQYQESLSGQYHQALVAAESKQQEQKDIRKQNIQLMNWMRKLNVACYALKDSRRWKLGCAIGRLFEIISLRPKSPTAFNQINGIFDQFGQTTLKPTVFAGSISENQKNIGMQLLYCLADLKSYFHAFIGSHRWRWGNKVVRFLEILLLRRKPYLAVDQMASIFDSFVYWQQHNLSEKINGELTHFEIMQMQNWLRKLEHNFQATLASRRWRLGNAFVRFLMLITFRPKRPLVTNDIKRIFNDYREYFAG